MELNLVQDVSEELISFLKNNYIGSSSDYSLQYSKDFLEWALYGKKRYIIELRIKNNNGVMKLAGCITATVRNTSSEEIVIINFLCIHKDYRNKSVLKGEVSTPLTSLLKQELFKYVVHSHFKSFGLFTIAYAPTSITKNNTSVQNCYYINSLKYYHYPINIKKLVKAKYLPSNYTENNIDYKKPELVPMKENHMKMVMNILNTNLGELKYKYSKEDIKQQFLLSKVCKSYVKLKDQRVTEFISFYLLPSKVNQNSMSLNIAYVYCSTLSNIEEVIPILKDLNVDELKYLTYKKPDSNKEWLEGESLNYYSFSKKLQLLPEEIDINMV